MKTDLSFWQWLHSRPELEQAFNTHMTGLNQVQPHWFHIYPITALLADSDKNPKSVLACDMGGGIGQDMSRFRQAFPDTPGRVIVQDRPPVVAQALQPDPATGTRRLHEAVEAMSHNILTEQPVKGARIYHMGKVLHNWPDESVQEILRQLKPAMTPGYSKLLLSESVAPDDDQMPPFVAAMDLQMMDYFGSGERSESAWRELLASQGFQLTKVFRDGRKHVIEVDLAS